MKRTIQSQLDGVLTALTVVETILLCCGCSRTDAPPNPTKIVEPASAMDGDKPVPSKEEVERLFSKTDLARQFRIPGRFGFAPGKGVSKILFPKSAHDGAPANESGAAWVLLLDNATGEIVPESGDSQPSMEEGEIVELGLSDISDENMRRHLKSLKADIYQVPGLAVVTFRERTPDSVEGGIPLAPSFVLRVWVNTKDRSVFCGEVGN